MDIQNWVKPEVINQPAYRVKTVDFEIKMNQNESPWDLPQALKAEISDKIQNTDWNHYPDLISTKLKKKIAKLNGLKDDQIIVGKGSNEIFQAIFTATLSKGEEVCLLSPTFAVYQILAEHLEAKVINSTLNKSFEIDENDLLEKSKDAKKWESCSEVKGAGNSNKWTNYTTNDKDPYEGVSYYRLKQIDFDGQYNYSEIVLLNFDQENTNFDSTKLLSLLSPKMQTVQHFRAS